MSYYTTNQRQRRSSENIKKLSQYMHDLENKKNKTDLEIRTLKGLKRSLVCKWLVAIVTIIGMCWGIWIICIGTSGGLEPPKYDIETSYVKDGYIKYGRDDTLYDVSDLGYEEGKWLNIYINKDTSEVEMVKDLSKDKEEKGEEQGTALKKGAIILGGTFIFLIVGLIIALGIFEKPFRKWHKTYRQTF